MSLGFFGDLKHPEMSCSSSDPPAFCSDASPELKLYQAFIFSVPVFFTFILLVLFYVFYLRRRRANWASLRMRTSYQARGDMPRLSESGIKKEVRDMLPVVVYKESFLIRETQCSVCLGDYKPDERLKRIPPCGHTFHVDCIDHWLSTHTTCPLCRVSLIPAAKATTTGTRDPEREMDDRGTQANEVAVQAEEQPPQQRDVDGQSICQGNRAERERCGSPDELGCARRGAEQCVSDGEGSVSIVVESLAEQEGRSSTRGAEEVCAVQDLLCRTGSIQHGHIKSCYRVFDLWHGLARVHYSARQTYTSLWCRGIFVNIRN